MMNFAVTSLACSHAPRRIALASAIRRWSVVPISLIVFCVVILPCPHFMNSAAAAQRRAWKDVQGNLLVAEYYGLAANGQVRLQLDGDILQFPLAGFSSADQQWIQDQEAQAQVPPAAPPSRDLPADSATPSVLPQGKQSAARDSAAQPTSDLADSGEKGSIVEGRETMIRLKQQVEAREALADKYAEASVGTPPTTTLAENDFRAHAILCRQCQTTFTSDSGLETGDVCPHCSLIPFHFTGRMIRAGIAFVALFVGLIGLSLKKLFQAPQTPRRPTYQF